MAVKFLPVKTKTYSFARLEGTKQDFNTYIKFLVGIMTRILDDRHVNDTIIPSSVPKREAAYHVLSTFFCFSDPLLRFSQYIHDRLFIDKSHIDTIVNGYFYCWSIIRPYMLKSDFFYIKRSDFGRNR